MLMVQKPLDTKFQQFIHHKIKHIVFQRHQKHAPAERSKKTDESFSGEWLYLEFTMNLVIFCIL